MTRHDVVLLIGEDEAFPMYGEYLDHLGIRSVVRTSPPEALTELTRIRPPVIVSELLFGGSLQAGCDLLHKIRDDPSTAGAIVIVLTGYARAEDAALARRCGADQFFRKPLPPDDLGTIVRNALRHVREGTRPEWNEPARPPDRRKNPRSEY